MTDENGLENVLVFVDDEEPVLKLVKRIVGNIEDYTPVFFMDPRDAMDYMKIHKPALIWTDNDMPHIQGIELLAASRELSPGTKRVLYTSGKSDKIGAAIDSGVIQFYLQKPFDKKIFLDKLYDVLKK